MSIVTGKSDYDHGDTVVIPEMILTEATAPLRRSIYAGTSFTFAGRKRYREQAHSDVDPHIKARLLARMKARTIGSAPA